MTTPCTLVDRLGAAGLTEPGELREGRGVTGRVLLMSGVDERAPLAACRSLGRRGLEVHLLLTEGPCIASASRHVDRVADLGDCRRGVTGYVERLARFLSSGRFDLVIPLTDTAALICQSFRDRLRQYTRIALPGAEPFRYAHDKLHLIRTCAELGIPVPAYTVVRSLTEYRDARFHHFPCYVKPIHSAVIHNDTVLGFRVHKAQDPEALERIVRFHVGTVPVMVQEEWPGRGAGLYLLAREGRILYMVQQDRLHEPPDGGGSSYRMSAEPDPRLQQYAAVLVEAVGWTGVAMLEFKGDARAGNWTMMEINGRFWGSLSLTLAAGLDFPYWLYEMMVLGEVKEATRARPAIGVRRRHLGKDLGWLVRRLRTGPARGRVLLGWSADFRHLLARREGFDVESLSDPGPALAYARDLCLRPVRRLVRAVRWRAPGPGRRQREERVRRARASLRGAGAADLLFVCRGNICRSPFAEAYARLVHGHDAVKSAGTFPVPGRIPPREAEKEAAARGVDLTGHRSVVVDDELLARADVIVVMDRRNLWEITHAATDPDRIVMLGWFGEGGEVPDPLGRSPGFFGEVYDRIAGFLDRMFRDG